VTDISLVRLATATMLVIESRSWPPQDSLIRAHTVNGRAV
jgi:hypothetical protein